MRVRATRVRVRVRVMGEDEGEGEGYKGEGVRVRVRVRMPKGSPVGGGAVAGGCCHLRGHERRGAAEGREVPRLDEIGEAEVGEHRPACACACACA